MPKGLRNWRRVTRLLVFTALCGVLCILAAPLWLPVIGTSLVLRGGDARNATAAAEVLGVPDSPWLPSTIAADRLTVASDWIRERRARIVVMTCGTVYGISGCEMAQERLVAEGRQRLPLREVPLPYSPAEVEAAALLAEISRIGAASAIILVDPLESRRLNRIYLREAKKRGIRVEIITVPDPNFDPADWWRFREGRKAVAFELCQWVGFP